MGKNLVSCFLTHGVVVVGLVVVVVVVAAAAAAVAVVAVLIIYLLTGHMRAATIIYSHLSTHD